MLTVVQEETSWRLKIRQKYEVIGQCWFSTSGFATWQQYSPITNKKHLKNVGPIRHCDPFYIAIHQVSLLSHVARRLRIDVHDNDDDDNNNDNAWQRRPLWPHGMGPTMLAGSERGTHVRRRVWLRWLCPALCTCRSLRLCCWCSLLAVSASCRLAHRSTWDRWCRSATTQYII